MDRSPRGSTAPSPVVHRYMPSARPRWTTFVSPPMISTPAARAVSAIAWTSARRMSESSPSSRIIDTVRACGRAPAIARSLAVPLTASSPIEPPGKRRGETTKLSEVIASRTPPSIDGAGVAHRGERLDTERRHQQPLDQRLRRLAAGAVGQGDLLVSKTRSLGAGGLDDLQDALFPPGDAHTGLDDLPLARDSGRSCSTQRTPPPGRPCRCRSHARGCRRCRTPCTPTA